MTTKTLYIVCFLLIFASYVSLPAQSAARSGQNRDVIPEALLNRISVNLNNVPLRKALTIIAEKGKLKLNYNERN